MSEIYDKLIKEDHRRFTDSLPEKPYCTDDLRSGLVIRKREDALSKAYIQISQQKKSFIVLDLDYEGSALAYEYGDNRVPVPTITAINRENGHSHVFYELRTPVLFPLANAMESYVSQKAIRYYQNVREAYRLALKADPGFTGLIVKNPFHEKWEVIWYANTLYELEDLASWVDFPKKTNRKTPIVSDLGRNCTLFDETRFYAYEHVRNFGNPDQFLSELYHFCENYNRTFQIPLSESELRSVSRSVARWVWKNRYNFLGDIENKNRGAMNLQPIPILNPADREIEIRKRQKKGAIFTNQVRKDKTEEIIFQAIKQLRAEGKKVTKSKVAKMTNVHRVTLYRFGYLFETEESLKERFYNERVLTSPFLLKWYDKYGWDAPMVQGNYKSFISKVFPSQKAQEMVLVENKEDK
jgi:hypothetical protein